MSEILKIDRVISVSYTADPSCLAVTIMFDGENNDCIHYLRDDDIHGNSPYLRKWIEDNRPQILPYIEPDPSVVSPTVAVIPAVTLWERMTESEAMQVEAVMSTQPFRTRQIFMTAQTFRSDHELWPLLEQVAIELFGESRAAELLALIEAMRTMVLFNY